MVQLALDDDSIFPTPRDPPRETFGAVTFRLIDGIKTDGASIFRLCGAILTDGFPPIPTPSDAPIPREPPFATHGVQPTLRDFSVFTADLFA